MTDRPIGFELNIVPGTGTIIHPREINHWLLSPLLILENRLPIRKYRQGYLLAREDGLTVEGMAYDVAAGFSDKPLELPDFYSIPVRQTSADEEMIHHHLADDFFKEGYQRQIFHQPNKKNPVIFDLIPFDPDHVKIYHPIYFMTNAKRLRSVGEGGQKTLEQILKIIELCREGQRNQKSLREG